MERSGLEGKGGAGLRELAALRSFEAKAYPTWNTSAAAGREGGAVPVFTAGKGGSWLRGKRACSPVRCRRRRRRSWCRFSVRPRT